MQSHLRENFELNLHPTPADGNCLFRALALHILGNADFYRQVRHAIHHTSLSRNMQAIDRRRVEMEAVFRDDGLHFPDRAYNAIDDTLPSTSNDFGGEREIRLASIFYRVDITLHHYSINTVPEFNDAQLNLVTRRQQVSNTVMLSTPLSPHTTTFFHLDGMEPLHEPFHLVHYPTHILDSVGSATHFSATEPISVPINAGLTSAVPISSSSRSTTDNIRPIDSTTAEQVNKSTLFLVNEYFFYILWV
jgi:hypothetical protein